VRRRGGGRGAGRGALAHLAAAAPGEEAMKEFLRARYPSGVALYYGSPPASLYYDPVRDKWIVAYDYAEVGEHRAGVFDTLREALSFEHKEEYKEVRVLGCGAASACAEEIALEVCCEVEAVTANGRVFRFCYCTEPY